MNNKQFQHIIESKSNSINNITLFCFFSFKIYLEVVAGQVVSKVSQSVKELSIDLSRPLQSHTVDSLESVELENESLRRHEISGDRVQASSSVLRVLPALCADAAAATAASARLETVVPRDGRTLLRRYIRAQVATIIKYYIHYIYAPCAAAQQALVNYPFEADNCR